MAAAAAATPVSAAYHSQQWARRVKGHTAGMEASRQAGHINLQHMQYAMVLWVCSVHASLITHRTALQLSKSL